MRRGVVMCVLLTVSGARGAASQTPVDSALLSYIASIKAIDNHAHPMRVVREGAPPDTDVDALPLDGLQAVPLPAMMRPESRYWYDAWHALYGYTFTDADSAHRALLATERRRVMQAQGDSFPSWVLDRCGIDIMFANRVAMGAGLTPARFRWVAFVDPLMLPLDSRGEGRTPDTRALYPLETKLLRRYMRELGVAALPGSLDAYLRTVVTPMLERVRREGGVAVKFEAGYLRSLDFSDPRPATARAVYARYVRGGVPAHADYTALQDFLFHYIAREAGRLGMAVHIHTLGAYGAFYSVRGSEPYALETVFNDSTLRGTTFVMLHGGWPLTRQTLALLGTPNVYADISAMTSSVPAPTLAAVLREWLGAYPEKVLFATDAFPTDAQGGWEDVAWVSANNGRRALAMALTGMMADGEIDRAGAERLARMVMRENALGLYHLGR